MKIKTIRWVAVGVIVLIAGLCFRSCNLYNQNSLLRGRYQELRRITNADHDILTKENSAKDKIIKNKTGEIADLLANADKPTESEKAKDKIIAEKEKEIARLKAKGDYKAALEQSQAENRAWSEKFTLAEERHKKDLFNLNASWQIKFDAQVNISDGWKKDRDNEFRLRILAEKRIGGLESSLRWSRFWKTGTTILAVVGVIHIIEEKIS